MHKLKRAMKSMTAVIALGLLVAGCGGGSEDIDGGDGLALLSGSLAFTGATLADLADPAVVGELDGDKWALRVIDPTESVDSIVVEHEDTAFPAVAVSPLDIYLLSFELLPAVDLSGGAAEVTPLELEIAVPAVADIETKLSAAIELVVPSAGGGMHGASQTDGYRIRLRYTISGPSSGSELVEIDWNRHQLRHDSNGDGMLDDEPYFADSDRNGISDNRQQGYISHQGTGPLIEASGVIDHIDPALNRITVDGQVFLVDELTRITDNSDQPIAFDSLSAGQLATATGRKGRFGNVYAASIAVADSA